MKRRDFIYRVSAGVLLLANGQIVKADPNKFYKKPRLRFAVVSDWHYGQAQTDFDNDLINLSRAFKKLHADFPCDFIVVNGDIIHDDIKLLNPAVVLLRQLHPTLYVTKGNHDRVSDAVWEKAWGMPVNHDIMIKDQVILLGNTSNEAGDYLSPDMEWFSKKLDQYKSFRNVFIFLHINPIKLTKNATDSPDFKILLQKYSNIRGVFNGHDHDVDGVLMSGNIPFIFDGHMGGNWGTAYRGFRIIELRNNNSLLTYMMDPISKRNETIL